MPAPPEGPLSPCGTCSAYRPMLVSAPRSVSTRSGANVKYALSKISETLRRSTQMGGGGIGWGVSMGETGVGEPDEARKEHAV